MTDSPSFPALGDVWRYPFLWSREASQGETEGRKNRACAIALLIGNADGKPEVLLVPVTSQPSSGHPFAVEVPELRGEGWWVLSWWRNSYRYLEAKKYSCLEFYGIFC